MCVLHKYAVIVIFIVVINHSDPSWFLFILFIFFLFAAQVLYFSEF